MGVFERYLTVWVFLCIAAGIGLGQVFPGFFRVVGRLEIARINLPVAVMIDRVLFIHGGVSPQVAGQLFNLVNHWCPLRVVRCSMLHCTI